ncbi:hypothetical protein VT52_006400 [Streptomyces malaysiense]|uniref:Uncharacterized protein n=2 Tax=Streptomyces malaysiense TaxID=1428626 RepID=A0A1J4Q5M9_9ACTN|nr:hypothetical protein VT52_006400 [Streptomyces malaysiense]
MAQVVLTGGRTRVWVDRGALHWRRGRTTVVVPGARIRRVEAVGRSLTVTVADDVRTGIPLTVRHRHGDVVAALGAEIEAIMGDADPSGNRDRVRRRVARAWPPRLAAGLRDRVLRGSPWWRRACWYVVLGLSTALLSPTTPGRLGLAAWVSLPVGLALPRMWARVTELDKRWTMGRRGVTVRAKFQFVSDSVKADSHHYVVHFRTLDGRKVTARTEMRGHRDEIRYDPRNPSCVIAPTRLAWLGAALAAFLEIGLWGVAFTAPAVIWLIEVLALPFARS